MTQDLTYGSLCSGQDANHGHSHLVAFGQNNTSGPNDISHALNANRGCHNPGDFEAGTLLVGQENAIAFAENSRSEVRYENGDGSITGAISTGGGKPGQGDPCIFSNRFVRRLTPKECERLQGFNDDHTAIPNWNGWRPMDESETPEQCAQDGMEIKQSKNGKWRVKDADGPRYKAIGNSMAVPVIRWIGQRIISALSNRGL